MAQDRAEVTNENVDPSVRLNADAAVNAFARAIHSSLNVCFPACIYSYDPETELAEVLPLVKKVYYKGEPAYLTRPTYQVRIRRFHFGGFLFWVPPMVGDTGWVISSDRNTELLKQDGALTASVLEKDREQSVMDQEYPQQPNSLNMHEFKEGFFIPDNWGKLDLSRCKDGDSLDQTRTLYIGTRIDTKDKYQSGTDYDNKDSCSLTMTRSDAEHPAELELANSGPSNDQKNALIRLSEQKINVIVKEKDKQIDVDIDPEGVMALGEGWTMTANKDAVTVTKGKTSLTLGDEEVYVIGNLTVTGSVKAARFVNPETE